MVEEKHEMSQILLRAFFDGRAFTNEHREEPVPESPPALLWKPLTRREVQDAVFRAKPVKTPGIDDIPTIAWQDSGQSLGSECTFRSGRHCAQA